jgi:decaprenyl-phosphate phosphoribosyltransferase
MSAVTRSLPTGVNQRHADAPDYTLTSYGVWVDVPGGPPAVIVDEVFDGDRHDHAAAPMSTVSAIVRSARPLQWTKNLLVFAAPGAAGVLDDWPELGAALLAFVAFCLASSGIYLWNDALDVHADRRHPTKRFRPVAAGQLGVGTAKAAGTVLLVAACAVAAGTGRWQTVAVVVTYIVATIAYSAWLKHVAVVDLVLVASGFVLRAAAGAVAVDVPMSKWFVLCTVFGSLFIVAGKRYAELREIGAGAGDVRPTLETYTPTYLRGVLTMSCGAAIISYCLWALETKELAGTDLPFYELSIVPMLTAMLRYLLLIEQGHGGAPEEVFANDRVLQLLGVLWVVTFGLGVYSA